MVCIEILKNIKSGMYNMYIGGILYLVDEDNIIRGAIDSECDFIKYKDLFGNKIDGKRITIDELFYNNHDLCVDFKITGRIRCTCYIDNNLSLPEECTKTYLNGVLHGPFKSIFSRGIFLNGVKQGGWSYYSYGKSKLSIFSNQYKECIKKVIYINGIREGQAEIKNHDSSIISFGSFKNGRKTGMWTFLIHQYEYNRYVLYKNGNVIKMIEIKKDGTPWQNNIKVDSSPYDKNKPSIIYWRKLTRISTRKDELIDFKEFNSRGYVKEGFNLDELPNLM